MKRLSLSNSRTSAPSLLSLCLSLFLFIILYAQPVSAQQTPGFSNGKNISYKLIQATDKTWGYDVYIDGKLTIHQLSVPGMSGTAGFKTRSGAERVVKLVVKKIRRGEVPPSVTHEEMKTLKAI